MDSVDGVQNRRGRKPRDLTEKVIGECLLPVGEPQRVNGNTYWECGCIGGYLGAFGCISNSPDVAKRTKLVAYSSISAKRQFSCGCKQGRKGAAKDGTPPRYIERPATSADYDHAGIPHLCPERLSNDLFASLGVLDLTNDTN